MDLLEFGHAGATILAFSTSKGRFFEWEDHGMIDALRHQMENGWFRLICVDSVDSESWYADWKHPGARVWRHTEYDHYLASEVLPFIHSRSMNSFLICAGASFGAYHALSFGMRYPQHVQRILAMSGLCDIKMFTDGFYNEQVYFHNPIDFIPNESDVTRLYHQRQQNIILAVGKDDQLVHQNRELSGKLWNHGIGNALREWDGFAHDWPVWHKMIDLYISGLD